jgi:hypothetical protein
VQFPDQKLGTFLAIGNTAYPPHFSAVEMTHFIITCLVPHTPYSSTEISNLEFFSKGKENKEGGGG